MCAHVYSKFSIAPFHRLKQTYMSVDIKGIDKVQLLEELWTAQKVASWFLFHPVQVPPFDRVKAKEAVAKQDDIDYFQGRAIKLNLTNDSIDPWVYDRDAGPGTFKKIVDQIRDRMK